MVRQRRHLHHLHQRRARRAGPGLRLRPRVRHLHVRLRLAVIGRPQRPDNVCVSPRGGLVLCEDGSGREYLHGLTPDGEIFRFAENNVVLPPEYQDPKGYSGDFTGSEWAGATFDPKNGNWLFVNLQSPGITFAITGRGVGALWWGGCSHPGNRRAVRR